MIFRVGAFAALVLLFGAATAAAQSVVWSNDWRPQAAPTYWLFSPDTSDVPPNQPLVFAPNGDLLLRTTGNQQDDELLHLDPAGHVLWRTHIGHIGYMTNDGSGGAMIALGDGGAIAAASSGTSLVRLDAAGHQTWTAFVSTQRLVVAATTFVAQDYCGSVTAVDGASGQIAWQFPVFTPYCSGGGLVAMPGGDVVASFNRAATQHLVRLDSSGHARWDMTVGSGVDVLAATDSTIYVSTPGPGVSALDASDGHALWSASGRYAGTVDTPAELVVLTASGAARLAADTGAPRWVQAALSGYGVVLQADRIGNDRFMLDGFLLDVASGNVLWSTPPARSRRCPAVVRGISMWPSWDPWACARRR